MRRALVLCLFITTRAFADESPCEPLVRIEESSVTADFRKCSVAAVDVKYEVELEIAGATYRGYVSQWSGGVAQFQLNDELRSSPARTGTLTVFYGKTVTSWRVRLVRPFANAPAPEQQSPVQQSAVEATGIKQAPVNTAGVEPDGGFSETSIWSLDDDVIAIELRDGELRAATAAGDIAVFDGNKTWVLSRSPLATEELPLRYATSLELAELDYVNAAGERSSLSVAEPVNAASGLFAVGDGGAFHVLRNGWEKKVITDRNLYAILVKSPEYVFAAGEKGTILEAPDAGYTWRTRDVPTTADLRAISLTPSGIGYAAGSGGVILRSEDKGATWTHVTREAALPRGLPLPAPWYILLNLMVTVPALVLAARGRPNEESIEQTESIADRLVSDRALEAGEPDALNLRSIALGISRFLRNEKTVPPLTVAVTGEWGSGKSSLMNLLKADLAEFGFRPVWFNAWHHQKEHHFLASLVQAVRDEAAPPWWHVPFRSRLLWLRAKRHPGTVALVLLVVAVLFSYEAHDDHNVVGAVIDALQAGTFWDLLADLPSKLKDEFAIVISVASAIGALWKGLQSFAAKPAALLATVSSQAKMQDLDREISFRGRFAPQFRDVTTALGDRPLVLFIDDLDRCEPNSVREMLEAINYLVTSGDCFIVLGIDRTRVERYLNIAFGAAADGETNFAANYLDKLINIEVPVPAPNDREALQILRPAKAAEVVQGWWVEGLRAAMAAAWRLKPAMMAAAVIATGVFIGSTMKPRMEAPPANTVAVSPVAPLPNVAAASVVKPLRSFRTGTPGDAIPGEPHTAAWALWPIALLLASASGVALWLSTRKPGLVVHDSDEFVAALEAWQPLLVARNRTPRSLKRFVNRVRYLAMRQRPQEEDVTMWRALRAVIAGRRVSSPLVPDGQPIPEPALVALAAMSYNSSSAANHDEAMRVSRMNHEAKFGPLDTRQWAPQFSRIVSDVRVN